MSGDRLCKCGCRSAVPSRRVFVNAEHHLEWMVNGGARVMNALQPMEAKARGGQVAGRRAAESGRLRKASAKGAKRLRQIAAAFRRARRGRTVTPKPRASEP